MVCGNEFYDLSARTFKGMARIDCRARGTISEVPEIGLSASTQVSKANVTAETGGVIIGN